MTAGGGPVNRAEGSVPNMVCGIYDGQWVVAEAVGIYCKTWSTLVERP
jgi:hypothetical protein